MLTTSSRVLPTNQKVALFLANLDLGTTSEKLVGRSGLHMDTP